MTVLIVVTVVGVLVTGIEDSVGRGRQLFCPLNDAVGDRFGIRLTHDHVTRRRQESHAVLSLFSDRDDEVGFSNTVSQSAHARTLKNVIQVRNTLSGQFVISVLEFTQGHSVVVNTIKQNQ